MGVLPVLDRRATLGELGRQWGLVYAGNMIGCIIFAALIVALGPVLNLITPEAFASLAKVLKPGIPKMLILLIKITDTD